MLGVDTVAGTKMVVYPNVDDIFGDKVQSIADAVVNIISQYAQQVSIASANTMKAKDLQTMFDVPYDLLFKEKIPIAEVLYSPSGAQALNSLYWGLLPSSRWNVHITSSDPKDMPAINPTT